MRSEGLRDVGCGERLAVELDAGIVPFFESEPGDEVEMVVTLMPNVLVMTCDLTVISRPTRRKKTAIKPSLIQPCNVSDRTWEPTSIARGVFQKRSYGSAQGELAIPIAATPHSSRSAPPADSVWKNR